MTNCQTARERRTALLHDEPETFMAQLRKELKALIVCAEKKGFRPVARLNGTSDLDWTVIAAEFPAVFFYDYTKRPQLAVRALEMANYDVTFSRSEVNDVVAKRMLDKGVRVAVVFDVMPDQWYGIDVVNGDAHDFRFLDQPGVVVGLKAKGKAKKDTSGFVVQTNPDKSVRVKESA